MKKLKKKKLTRFLMIAIVLYACYVLIQQQVRIHDIDAEMAAYQQKIESAQSENEELNNTKGLLETDEYYEKLARQRLGLVKPDEKVFVHISK